jgi:hypothetical protein
MGRLMAVMNVEHYISHHLFADEYQCYTSQRRAHSKPVGTFKDHRESLHEFFMMATVSSRLVTFTTRTMNIILFHAMCLRL